MDEATLERHLHLTMTLIGGFMGGYAILNRHDVFGSAQTGNMLSLAMDAVGHPDEQWFFRVLAMMIYIVSMAATVVISHKISKINQKRLSILIDGAVLLVIGFYPAEMIRLLHCFRFFLLLLSSGVLLKVPTVLQVPVFFPQIICVSVLQDLPNIFAAKIQNLFEEESISERY